MPFVPDTPEPGQIQVVQAANFDKFNIEWFRIDIDPNNEDNNRVIIVWSKGYMDGTTYMRGTRTRSMFSGATFNAAASALSDGAKSHYDNIKEALWQLLIDAGEVSGTIT